MGTGGLCKVIGRGKELTKNKTDDLWILDTGSNAWGMHCFSREKQ
jgi:hypothetical protein